MHALGPLLGVRVAGAGQLEDEDDDAAKVAAMIPSGPSLRLPGLGHGAACAASALTVPIARAFLDRWFA